MTETKPATLLAETPTPALPKARRKITDYLIPPIVIPAALSMVILIYILVRGPV
jgi:hypothetical protein